MGIRRRYCVSSYHHLDAKAEQAVGLREHGTTGWTAGPLDLKDITVMPWKLKRVPLLLIGIYLDASIGLRGNNMRKLCTLASIVKDHAGPWIAVGDWDNEPWQLEQDGWLEKLGAQTRVPCNSGHTCTIGRGRLIDYVVCSHSATGLIQRVSIDDEAAGAHYGVTVDLRCNAELAMRQVLNLPRRFDLPGKKAKEKDPQSKRSRKVAAVPAERPSSQPQTPAAAPELSRRHRIVSKSVPPLRFVRAQIFDFDDPDAGPLVAEHEQEVEDIYEPLFEDESEMEPVAATENEVLVHPSEAWTDEAIDLLWESRWNASGTHGFDPWLSPPQYIKDSSSFRSHPDGARALGVLYGRWSHTVEQYFCDLSEVSIDRRKDFCGRGRAVNFRHKAVGAESSPGSAHTDAGGDGGVASRAGSGSLSEPPATLAERLRSVPGMQTTRDLYQLQPL